MFNFRGAYGTDDVYTFLRDAQLLGADDDCTTTCTPTESLSLATDLPELITEIYDDGKVVDGFVKLTASIVLGIGETLAIHGYDTSPGSRYSVAPCGVYLSDVLDQSVDPSTGLCTHDENCECQVPAGLCVMMTDLSVVPDSTSFSYPLPNSSDTCETIERTWGEDSIEVSFIVVSNWFQSVEENADLNRVVQAALEASLCEPAGQLSFMRSNLFDIGGVVSDWDAILHPDMASSSFLLGFKAGDALCSDLDSDGICDCDDDCDDSADDSSCCTDTDSDGLCNAVDICPRSPDNDADGDGWCNCTTAVYHVDGEMCDCDDADPFIGTVCPEEPDQQVVPNKFCLDSEGIQQIVGVDFFDADEDGLCDEDSPWVWAIIGTLAGVLVVVASVAAYARGRAMMQLHLQVYQKEVFYEALNRNRQAQVRLMDAGDGGYILDPDQV